MADYYPNEEKEEEENEENEEREGQEEEALSRDQSLHQTPPRRGTDWTVVTPPPPPIEGNPLLGAFQFATAQQRSVWDAPNAPDRPQESKPDFTAPRHSTPRAASRAELGSHFRGGGTPISPGASHALLRQDSQRNLAGGPFTVPRGRGRGRRLHDASVLPSFADDCDWSLRHPGGGHETVFQTLPPGTPASAEVLTQFYRDQLGPELHVMSRVRKQGPPTLLLLWEKANEEAVNKMAGHLDRNHPRYLEV